MSNSNKIVLATKSSQIRWLILAVIVVFAFSADYLLQRDIRTQVRQAWLVACAESMSPQRCEARVETHQDVCFDGAYTSMIFTLGRSRWESFKLIDYESCMNRESSDISVAKTQVGEGL